MSVREIIAQVGGLLSGRVEQAVLLAWFNEIELMVQMQLFGISRADAVQYTKETIDATPIVEGHYQRVYSYWLLAKGHSRLQNTSGYERNRKLYISEYEAYRKWVIRTHGVTQAEKDRNGGYWSAYGIACKHGFVGSEQEWLQSLHGRDGADGLPGPQGAPGKDGKDGKDGRDGKDGKDGADGAQAGEYDLAYDTATHTLQLLCNKQSVRSFDLTQNGSTVYVQTACKALVCTKQDDARVTYTWSSDASGGGSATYIVNGKAVASEPVEQGEVCFSAGAYLQDGRNHLCVRVCDGQGSTAELDIWVNVVTLHVSSSLVADQPITGEITVRYAVAGLGQKTVYFLVDGQEVGTRQAEQPGKQQSFLLGTLSHGAHVLEIYASTFVGEQEVRSNTLHYELLCVQPDHTAPIIASCFHTKQIAQYAHLRIPYWVYLPDNLQSAMEVWVDGVQASTLRLPPYRGEYEYVCDQSGEHCVTFRVGQTTREFRFTVTEAQREARVETDDLMLWLDASGRNNAEETPARWSYRNAGGDEIQAAFSGFDWIRDGWQRDVSGVGYLRIPKGGRVCVPLAPFTREAREQGVTVEVLLAIRNVADRNAVVMQCVSGTGLEVRASRASLISEQTTLSCSLGDEQILHLCFVVRPEGEGRLMQIFVDGVLSAVAQYGVNDYWAQRVPAELTLGGDDCSTDVYMLRVYQNALRASGVVGNYASCASSAGTVTAALERNAVCGENGEILPATLPAHASYVLLKAQSLPTQQGMARSCSGSYQSGAYPELSCSFANAELEADAEGDMILYLLGGATASDGAMREGILLRPYSIPGKELRLDAHMRNSDGTANAALISLYDQVCPFESAAQKQDARYASGPDAIPISVFWQNEQTGEVRFVGKYNLCYETSCPENFGYVETELPRRQIWRALNDVSERVLFQSADFSGTDWKRDFVSEFPVGFADVRDLARLVDWVASCNPDAATEQALPVACTLDGVEYTQDSAAYRLAKFRTEVEEYFDLSDLVWYYLFTELFLCVEARAKQMRLATDDGERWYFLPWDFSASLGADARGVMRFDYSVLDGDEVDGRKVFGAADSVLWRCVREGLQDKIKQAYAQMRAAGNDTYVGLEQLLSSMQTHRDAWGETVYNRDAWLKYIAPLLERGDASYMSQAQGSKAALLADWLKGRFFYLDSKYAVGEAAKDSVLLYANAASDLTLLPLDEMFLGVAYGSALVQERAERAKQYTLPNPFLQMQETLIRVYGAAALAQLGDLWRLYASSADVRAAKALTELRLGSGEEGYQNSYLTSLALGDHSDLRVLDVRNCPSLAQALSLQGCTSLSEVYAKGSGITGITLPQGKTLRVLQLPATLRTLDLRDQSGLMDFSIEGCEQLKTLRLENVPVDSAAMVAAAKELERARLIGIDWEINDAGLLDRLADRVKGIAEDGSLTSCAIVSGNVCLIDVVDDERVAHYAACFPDLILTVLLGLMDCNGLSICDSRGEFIQPLDTLST